MSERLRRLRVLMEKEVIEASELEDLLGPAARDAGNGRTARPMIPLEETELGSDWLKSSPGDLR